MCPIECTQELLENHESDKKNRFSVFGGKLCEKLKSIPLLHVAGTKGKGTTCAYAETILRARGFKTGLFTSPSFNSVAERIRINGKPVCDEQFAATAEKLEKLDEVKVLRESELWFAKLTLLALQTFVEQKVDVIILEVGIGGALCSTSAYPRGAPRVCCVTALGYDHLDKLGYSIEEISASKAGIFRRGATLITSKQEYEEALSVLKIFANEKQANLLSPSQELIDSTGLEYPNNENAASAILAVRHLIKSLKQETFFQRLRKSSSSTESDLMKIITPTEMKAIYSAEWPGRQQIVEHEINGRIIRILLDVAHTPESMKICANWAAEKKQGKMFVLMRSAMGREIDSQMVHLAEILKPEYFAGSPNVAKDVAELDQNDGSEKYVSFYPSFLTRGIDRQLEEQRERLAIQSESARKFGLNTFEFESVNDCLENLPEDVGTVLITGSLYMVAAFFRLRPDVA
ncbi:unnamed protein product [Oikopleura dioica]|uniref:tetrahydrofolate synthase n=1 Tax=Oikopleura dioica TaxID=34765 RepID=E4XR49_OIKDI|nr:unnamed protein product [Oikopleura dioica]